MEKLEKFQMYPVMLIHNLKNWCERHHMPVILATPSQLTLKITEDNQHEIFSLCQFLRKVEFNRKSDRFPALSGISFNCQDMGECFLDLSFFHTSVLEFLVDYVQNSFSFIYDIQEYQMILKMLKHLSFYSSSGGCLIKDEFLEKYVLYIFDKSDELNDLFPEQFVENNTISRTFYTFYLNDLKTLKNCLDTLDNHLELKKIRGDFS